MSNRLRKGFPIPWYLITQSECTESKKIRKMKENHVHKKEMKERKKYQKVRVQLK